MSDKEKKLPQFDPDLSPTSEVNERAALARNLFWDRRNRAYVDEDGALVFDQCGQELE